MARFCSCLICVRPDASDMCASYFHHTFQNLIVTLTIGLTPSTDDVPGEGTGSHRIEKVPSPGRRERKQYASLGVAV